MSFWGSSSLFFVVLSCSFWFFFVSPADLCRSQFHFHCVKHLSNRSISMKFFKSSALMLMLVTSWFAQRCYGLDSMATYHDNGCSDLPHDFCSDNGISQGCNYFLKDQCGRAACHLDSHMWLSPCLPQSALSEYRARGCASSSLIGSDFCSRYNGGDCMPYVKPSWGCGRMLCQGDNHNPDILDYPCVPATSPPATSTPPPATSTSHPTPNTPASTCVRCQCDDYNEEDSLYYLENGCADLTDGQFDDFCDCMYGCNGITQGSWCIDNYSPPTFPECGRLVCQGCKHEDLNVLNDCNANSMPKKEIGLDFFND